jgi:hypothetical protein
MSPPTNHLDSANDRELLYNENNIQFNSGRKMVRKSSLHSVRKNMWKKQLKEKEQQEQQ